MLRAIGGNGLWFSKTDVRQRFLFRRSAIRVEELGDEQLKAHWLLDIVPAREGP